MENLEEKMGAILSNPQLMQQIMSMAQSLGNTQPQQQSKQEVPEPELPALPQIDPAMLQKIMGIMGQTGIDSNQRALLSALRPYLTGQRLGKLEKAMRSAKLASLASTFLGNGGLSILTGR